MLKKLILAGMILSTTILFGQTTKQIDYFKTLALNLSDLQDYMINAKFDFNGTKSDSYGEIYTWAYDRDRNNVNNAESFYRLYLNRESKSISFQSQIKGDYLRFKNSIKSKGLIYRKSENINGALVETFSNSKYESRIWTYLNRNITSYEMNLEMKYLNKN